MAKTFGITGGITLDKQLLKEKLDNFWYYYKIHVLVGIFIVFVVVYSIVEAAGAKGCALNVTMLGQTISEEKVQTFQAEATKRFVNNPKKEVVVDFMYYTPGSADQTAQATISKIAAELAAKELDVVVMDRQMFDVYARDGAFLRLDNAEGLEALNGSSFKLVNGKDDGGRDYPCGIQADEVQTLKDIGYDTSNKIICIPQNSQRMQISISFLKWMLGIK